MVVAGSNCSRTGIERRSNRSRIVVVTAALAVRGTSPAWSGQWRNVSARPVIHRARSVIHSIRRTQTHAQPRPATILRQVTTPFLLRPPRRSDRGRAGGASGCGPPPCLVTGDYAQPDILALKTRFPTSFFGLAPPSAGARRRVGVVFG